MANRTSGPQDAVPRLYTRLSGSQKHIGEQNCTFGSHEAATLSLPAPLVLWRRTHGIFVNPFPPCCEYWHSIYHVLPSPAQGIIAPGNLPVRTPHFVHSFRHFEARCIIHSIQIIRLHTCTWYLDSIKLLQMRNMTMCALAERKCAHQGAGAFTAVRPVPSVSHWQGIQCASTMQESVCAIMEMILYNR